MEKKKKPKTCFQGEPRGRRPVGRDCCQFRMTPSLLGAPETNLSRARRGWQLWGQQAARGDRKLSGQAVPSLPRTAVRGHAVHPEICTSPPTPCPPPAQGKCHQRPGWGPLPWPGALVAPLISTRNSGQIAFQEPFLHWWVLAHRQGLGGCVTPDELHTSLGLHCLTCRMEKTGRPFQGHGEDQE